MNSIRIVALCAVVLGIGGCSGPLRQWYAEGMPLPPVFQTGPVPGVPTTKAPEPAPPRPEPEPEPEPVEVDVVTRLRSADKQVVLKALFELTGEDTVSDEVRSEYNRLLKVDGWSKVKLEVIGNISLLDNPVPHVQALGKALSDADPEVREEACTVLEDTEHKTSVDVLIDNLSNPYRDTRELCQEALEWLTDKEFRTKAEWQAWWKNARKGFTF
jgi:hypothetical protein